MKQAADSGNQQLQDAAKRAVLCGESGEEDGRMARGEFQFVEMERQLQVLSIGSLALKRRLSLILLFLMHTLQVGEDDLHLLYERKPPLLALHLRAWTVFSHVS